MTDADRERLEVILDLIDRAVAAWARDDPDVAECFAAAAWSVLGTARFVEKADQ